VLALGFTLPAHVAQATGTTYYVDATTGNDGADCLTPTTACLTINAAIQRAASGDTVNIAAGTYDENVVIDRSLTLTGADQATTIIDGGGSGDVVQIPYISLTPVVTISKLTLQNGWHGLESTCTPGVTPYCTGSSLITLNNDTISNNKGGTPPGGDADGGGILADAHSTLVVNGCTITNNHAGGTGGGIEVGGAGASGSLQVDNSTISNNSASLGGGGIVSDEPTTINNSQITGNSSGDQGGGIYDSGALALTNSTISGNSAVGGGGGIDSNGGAATLILVSTVVTGNTAYLGGGILENGDNMTLTNTTVSSNVVGGYGGGIVVGSGVVINHSTITGNQAGVGNAGGFAGGLFISPFANSVYLQNTGITQNTVGGIESDCYGTLTNLGGNTIENLSGCSVTGGLPHATTLIPGTQGTDSLPVINWKKTVTLQVQGCSGGTGSYQISQDGTVIRTGTLTEGPAGTYTASIAPLSPNHGAAAMQYTITCNGTPITTIFGLYIDPSGVVMDSVSGQPLAGATVTLYSAPSPDGPFTVVPNGDPSMSPANQTNPDTSAADGSFGWDVVPGYYQIRAARAGCTSPTDPTQPYVETAVLTVPPPADNLVLTLACSGTVLYPRLDQPAPALATMPASYHFGLWDAASSLQGPNARSLATSPGSAQQASTAGYLYQAGDASPSMALDGEFLSAPLAAQTIPAGAWSVGLGIQGSLLNAGVPDYTGYLILNVINGSTGQVRGTLVSAPIGAEKTTEGSEVTAYQATVQGGAVTVQAGDYLEAEIGVRTLSSSAVQNTTLYTSGTTAIATDGSGTSSADSFIQAPTSLSFQ
jgi:hypothetical protein